MLRFLFLAALVLTVVAAIRALARPRVTGTVRHALEPEYVRSEDFVEILSREESAEVASARARLDARGIPTMVVATTLMVPRSRLDEARDALHELPPP